MRSEVEVTEEYCKPKEKVEYVTRPVQAVCIDDSNMPHPASRVDGETAVDGSYDGEIYRCVAGAHMQVTVGAMTDGAADFSQGEGFSCAKGEALWHAPGGALSCRVQAPQRNCNERSLLRKFGPGVKLVTVATPTQTCEPATRTRKEMVTKEVKVRRALPLSNIQLDGGVGGGVW